MSRPCGPNRTSINNAYTKNELVVLAMKKKRLPEKEAKRLTIPQLCNILGIKITKPLSYDKSSPEYQCKNNSKSQLVSTYIEKLKSLNIEEEEALEMSKDYLCDVIFDLQADLVVPEDFDKKTCNLYDIAQLKRLARTLGVEYQSSDTKEEICRNISVEYFIKKNKLTFDTSKEPKWTNLIKGDYECLVPPNEDLRLEEHQKLIAKHMLTHRGLLAVHSVGSGKTLSAVTAINCVLGKYPNLKVIIITPLSLKRNFEDEMLKFGINIKDINYAARIRIFSYEGFINYIKKHPDCCRNTFLIVDEAHNIKTEVKLSKDNEITKGGRAYYIMKCAANAFKVLLLTATPIVNRPDDLRNLLMMVNGIEPEKAQTLKYFKSNVLSNTDSFINEFKCKASVFSIKKDDTYPERIQMPINNIIMDNDYYNKYKAIEQNEINNSAYFNLVGNYEMFYTSLRRAVNALDGEQSPKVKTITDFIIKEAKEGRKSLVYSNWKAAGMNLIRSVLDKSGVPYSFISGDLTPDQRELFKNKINSGASKILLISRAGGEGLNLKEIRNVIIMESNWNPATDEQIIGRAVRKFSHSKLPKDQQNVRIYRYIMKKPAYASDDKIKSVDEVLYDLSYNKKLPENNKFMELLIKASIENNNCKLLVPENEQNCKQGDCTTGLAKRLTVEKTDQAVVLTPEERKELLDKINLPQEEKEKLTDKQLIEKSKRSDAKFVYKAADGLTSIAIDISEVGILSFKKLAGITGDVVKRRRILDEDELEVMKIEPKKRRKIIIDDDDNLIENNLSDQEKEEDDELEANLITSSQEQEANLITSSQEQEEEIQPKKKFVKRIIKDDLRKRIIDESESEEEIPVRRRKIVDKKSRRKIIDDSESEEEPKRRQKVMDESEEDIDQPIKFKKIGNKIVFDSESEEEKSEEEDVTDEQHLENLRYLEQLEKEMGQEDDERDQESEEYYEESEEEIEPIKFKKVGNKIVFDSESEEEARLNSDSD
jgi:superfamily II DNA or RNA helicase